MANYFTIHYVTIHQRKYKVRSTEMPLLLVEVRGEKAYGGVGLRTHPPAPSQREGGSLHVKVCHFKLTVLNHWLASLLICEKVIPLPFGKGLGDGLLA